MKRLYTVLGVLCLCNPTIGVFDLFPDALGFLFFYLALAQGSYVNRRLTQTRRLCGFLGLAEVPKIALGVWYLSSSLHYPAVGGLIADENLSVKTILLTVQFLYSIAEIYFYKQFFDGLYDGIDEMGALPRLKKPVTAEACKKRTLWFVILRCVFAFLPETLYLADMDYLVQDLDGLLVDIRLAHPVIAVGVALLFLAVCIPWAHRQNRLFGAIRKEGIYARYCRASEQADPLLAENRRLRHDYAVGTLLFLFGFVFLFTLKFDRVYAVFHCITPLLWLFAANRFSAIQKAPKALKRLCTISFLVSLIADGIAFYNRLFVFEKWANSHDAVIKMTEPVRRQQTFQLLCAGAALLSFGLILFTLYRFIKYLTAVADTEIGGTSSLQKLRERCTFEEEKKRLRAKPRRLFWLWCLCGILAVVQEIPYFAFYLSPLPILHFTVTAVALFLTASFLRSTVGTAPIND